MSDKPVAEERTQEKKINVLSGIRTHDPGYRVATDLRFILRGHLDRPLIRSPSGNVCGRAQILKTRYAAILASSRQLPAAFQTSACALNRTLFGLCSVSVRVKVKLECFNAILEIILHL